MMMRACWVLLAVFLALNLQAQMKKQDAVSNRFAELADRFMKESLALSPVSASQAGYHQHPDKKTGKVRELDAELDDLSPQAFAAQVKFYRDWQNRFRKETPLASLSAEDAADWQLVDDQISLNLLELEKIQSYRHNPTVEVELVGNALFLPLSQEYASQEVRLGHVISRIEALPTAVEQIKQVLLDADSIYVATAVGENEGNIDLVEHTVKEQIPAGSALEKRYNAAAPKALEALKGLNTWLKDDLGKRLPSQTWRLGKELYAEKFKYVMETDVTPEQVLRDAENEMRSVRAEMMQLALPMHKQMYPDHSEHFDLPGAERENKVIGEVLTRISDDHTQRDRLLDTVKGDLDGITQFIRDKKIVGLSDRNNLKVIPTPVFMRGIYSVAGFHNPPPLEPNAEGQYWVTPIDPSTPAERAESKLREYNTYTLKWLTIHEALPGHYIQGEHANSVEPARRRLLRALYSNGCYVEGWAEYVAQVMMEEGFLNHDPRFRLMMRKGRLRVLSNVILDVRLQTMNMSEQDALNLMINDAFQTRAEAEGKLQRAKLSSTQLPTYYVGILGWWHARKAYEQAMGPKFNLMQFHNRALDEGAVSLPALEKILLEKAASQR